MPRTQYVYIVKAFGYYKIGKAYDVERRISQLQTSLPIPLERVLTIQTKRHGLECALHHRFDHKRQQGEWFSLDSNDLEWITGFVNSSDYL